MLTWIGPTASSCARGRLEQGWPSRAGMAGAVSRWLGSVEGLSEIVQRLLRVQIESRPTVEVIQRYDSEETLFYCNPPYPHDSRSDVNAYGFEMKDSEHRALAEVLRKVKGKVALSSYHCKLMDELYGDWNCIESPPKKAHSTNTRPDTVKQDRVEVLWVNYDIPKRETTACQSQQPSSPTLFSEHPQALNSLS